ncbi:hypothetical protein ACQ3G6_17405 [Allorhizobium undicola]|uniref:hypothetical protein n=1 Tax=Allorhizobium undicola TaxID=78527 RepID=UPI003D348B94
MIEILHDVYLAAIGGLAWWVNPLTWFGTGFFVTAIVIATSDHRFHLRLLEARKAAAIQRAAIAFALDLHPTRGASFLVLFQMGATEKLYSDYPEWSDYLATRVAAALDDRS